MMNLLTVIEIQSNGGNIKCVATGPDASRKYSGWIELWRDGCFHKCLVSTNPIYASDADAIKGMEAIVTAVRKLDVSELIKSIGV